MSWLKLIVATATSCVAGTAIADLALVRSGEHAGFTRVVIDLPHDSDWTTSRTDDGVTITVDKGVNRFDLSRVYDRITTERVTGIRSGPNPGQLALTLACACEVETHRNGAMLVIDVMDPSDDTGVAARTGVFGHLRPLNFASFWPKSARPSEQEDVQRKLKQLPSPTLQHSEVFSSAIQDSLDMSEKRLIESIARAASQGLLKPRTGLPSWNDNAPSRVATNRNRQVHPAETATLPNPVDHMRLKGVEVGASRCIADADLDVVNWGFRDLYQGTSHWRLQLYGEFDTLNTDAAEGLARHLLSFGFGAEVVQLLSAVGIFNPALSAIAEIVDDIPTRKTSVFAGQNNCNSAAAFWAILEPIIAEKSANQNNEAAIRAFWNLPETLQRALGYRFAQRLQASGHQAASDIVMRHMTSRFGPVDRQSVLSVVDPLPDLATEGKESLQISDLAASNVQTAPAALSHMVKNSWSESKQVAPDTATLASAFAFENRQTDQARDLALTEALALAASGAFESAFRVAGDLNPPLGASEWAKILGRFIAFSSDVEFLKFALESPAILLKAGEKTDLDAVDRLLSLGFADQAHDMLSAIKNVDQTRDHKVLAARIALARRLPRQAEVNLLGLVGADVDNLRAQARDLAGDHGSAAEIYATLGSDLSQNRSAFMAEDWPNLVNAREPAISTFAQVKTQSGSDARETTLARNRALVEESHKVRSAIEGLLDSFRENNAFDPDPPIGE